MACSKLEAMAIYLVKQTCGNDILASVYTLNTCMPACNKHKKRGKWIVRGFGENWAAEKWAQLTFGRKCLVHKESNWKIWLMASLCILNSRGLVACKSKAALSTWGFSPLQPQANWNKVIINKSRGEIHISIRATHNSMCVFKQIWPKTVHLKAKSDSSLTFMLINFLVRTLQCTESLIFYSSCSLRDLYTMTLNWTWQASLSRS